MKEQEQLVKFHTAKLANEKGFDDNRNYRTDNMFAYYKNEQLHQLTLTNFQNILVRIISKKAYSAPQQSFLQTWLRNKHKIILLIFFKMGINAYSYSICYGDKKLISSDIPFESSPDDPILLKGEYKSYEEALENGLIRALELI